MSKNTVIVVAIVLVLGVAGFILGTRLTGTKSNSSATVSVTPGPATSNQGTQNSLDDLLQSATPIQCTFDNGGDLGKIYISAGKARLDFQSTFRVVGTYTTYEYHMITDGITLNVWKDKENTGVLTAYKILTPSLSSPTPSDYKNSPELISGAFLSTKNYGYKCTSWAVDASVFDPPQNVVFTKSSLLITTVTPVPSGNRPVQ